MNIFKVRSQLSVDRIETKITIKTLQRVGHVLRMDNERLASRWPAKERARIGSRIHITLDYCRKLIKDAGEDRDKVKELAIDRKKWS